MRLELTPDELLTTTRAVRRRLDLERPVEREVVEECLELAVQAPTGSNSQGWQWVFVDDPGRRNELAALYRKVFFELYAPRVEAGMTGENARVFESARYLAEHYHEVPLLLIPCLRGRPGEANQSGFWASILPAVGSFQLALRSRGLGSALTTMHLHFEKEAAEVLKIPYPDYSQAGMLPVAYTRGTDFRRAGRKPVASMIHWNDW